MRLPAIVIAVLLFTFALFPARAQSTFDVGYHEFEDTIAGMSYTGTWVTGTTGGVAGLSRSTSTVGSSVSFYVNGTTLVIWRLIRTTGNQGRMNVCINGGSCVLVVSEATISANIWYPYAIQIAPGSLVSFTHTLGVVSLDSFMVLSSASGSFSTPVPTATILPSSTPASTTTPQPTPTPQPTATPMSVVFAIDPEKSYGSANGQITSVSYSASAADIHLGNLLTTLLYSVWGMFFFAVFVLVRYRKK